MRTWVMTALMIMSAVSTLPADDNLKAFPPADKGMVRYVLHLPEKSDESAFKVELIIGKMVQVDKLNRYFFSGRIEAEDIAGWGFTRYVVSKVGPLAGTLMAVDPSEPKETRFITLGGDPYLIRYNSRLPVVIYVPEGFEARYRIWAAGKKITILQEG